MKILHITYHHGCQMQLDFVAKSLGYEITTQNPNWNYNIGHQRAEEIWNKHKEYYSQFDVIITSDTTPLSRIFLQNNYTGKLIIWVSNRFDYCDESSNDCKFPDQEYYHLIRNIPSRPNVKIFPNTPFEIEYARKYKNVQLNTEIIKPCSFIADQNSETISAISDPEKTFYISQYHNHYIFMNLKEKCDQLKIKSYYGRYNQLSDLVNIKGIINVPYAYSTISLFENWSMGNVFLIPSKQLLLKLSKQNNFWWQDSYALENCIDKSEWYLPEHKDLFLYFDNWEHLQHLTQDNETLNKTQQNVIQFSSAHNAKTLQQWKNAFENWKL
jgi:hypothetical protein